MTGGPPRGRVVTGRVTRIEACPCGGIVLSVGPISLRLDAEAAADVASTLAFAVFGARPGGAEGAPEPLEVPPAPRTEEDGGPN
jgi:hypothetical protein